MSVLNRASAQAPGWSSTTADTALLSTVRHWNEAIARLIGESGDFDVIHELCRLLAPSVEFDVMRIYRPGGATDLHVVDMRGDTLTVTRLLDPRMLPPLATEALGFNFPLDGDVVRTLELCRYPWRAAFCGRDRETLSAVEPLLALLLRRKWNVTTTMEIAETGSLDSRLQSLRERFPISERECEIVRFVVEGHSNYSISSHLDITVGTVKIHRKNIYRKLRISSQSELFSLVFST